MKSEGKGSSAFLVVDCCICEKDRGNTLKVRRCVNKQLQSIIEEEKQVIPTTIESLLFECIPSYKDEKFKQVLGIAKNRAS